MAPDFGTYVFVKDEGAKEVVGSEADRQRIEQLESKLANAAVEMEKARAQLVPTVTT